MKIEWAYAYFISDNGAFFSLFLHNIYQKFLYSIELFRNTRNCEQNCQCLRIVLESLWIHYLINCRF